MNLVKNMDVNDFVVYNGEDEEIKNRVNSLVRPRILYFSEERLPGEGIFIENNNVVLSYMGRERILFSFPDDRLLGKHIKLNILASALVCALIGVNAERIKDALLCFKPSNYRQTEVGNSLGIKIINDSKATNLAAVLMAVEEHKPNVLLVGGRGKCEDYSKLFCYHCFHDLVVYGEMRDEIKRSAKENGFMNIVECVKFDDAVNLALKLTKEGETLLFSPAGSSFDQFGSYKERGERFDMLIKNMEDVNS